MGLPPLIEALLDPSAYPDETAGQIELIQTHISYILLTEKFAYKIKKPVDFGFLDFTTLEKRRRFCEEEVRLNRRLAPEVYIGVVGIGYSGGRAVMGGGGKVGEYAVKMKRLDEDTILEEQLRREEVTGETIRKVARKIAHFHASAESGPRIDAYGAPEAVRKNVDENFSQTEGQVGTTISRRLYDLTRDFSLGFLDKNREAFSERVSGGFIKDCHGDIHTEHISISDGVEIFDCIEFNERFRFSDVVADIAFLSMDLDFHNRPDLAGVLDSEYFRTTGDEGGRGLMDFYRCYRAYVRGKVEGFKAAEKEVPAPERARAHASSARHYHLAGGYAAGGPRPVLIIVRGLSGTGKSTVAAMLSEAAYAPVISSDIVRKELAGVPAGEHAYAPYGEGIYSEEFTARTYREMTSRAAALLGEGRSCILDATFTRASLLDEAARMAEEGGAGAVHVFECTAPEEVARRRMEKRSGAGPPGAGPEAGPVSDMRAEIFSRQRAAFEPAGRPVNLLDTTLPAEELLKEAASVIYS